MHRHQLINPEPIQERIERIATVCGPSSFVLRRSSAVGPSSTACPEFMPSEVEGPGRRISRNTCSLGKMKQVFPPETKP